MCVAGARWVRSEILEKHPEAKIAVHAIWFRNVATDVRSLWSSDALNDPRVKNFWDAGRVAGKWYAANVTRRGAEVEWDAWILYAPGRAFADAPRDWGRPIVDTTTRLADQIERLLQDGAAPKGQ